MAGSSVAADPPSTAAMEIGDVVTWSGRRWIVRGFDPVSVTERTVLLEDPDTGERVSVPLEDVTGA